jgi:plasmid stabilization system protein ParE
LPSPGSKRASREEDHAAPAAEQDLEEAASFYAREGTPLVAARFIAEFKRLAALLVAHPEIGSPRTNGRRGFSMSVFPHTVIYRASADDIKIFVVKHDRKRPGFGATRS